MIQDSIIFFKAEYLEEVKEWLDSMGINQHDALNRFPRLNLEGIEIVFLPDSDHHFMFRLAMSHALSSRSIKITKV